ncbi:plasmid maintenance protein [Borrelia anserina]|uniref:Uncharacterized protein n=2 Tax=Borrelia anserina TaxID=143 RepID=W5SQ85_BORAN|nr:plasmid maintenance protein [Borrelia anserina]AHH09037.1 Hypothetical protein BAN_0007000 [Borrelia anserina BA2]APR65432.1 ORF-A-type protein [Borrelia anserina Es]
MRDTKTIKQPTSKHQHKLITLISTLAYINSRFKKYSQGDILFYFNGNLKRNGQSEVKIKTLRNYLYKLAKQLKVTTNYHKHLGINMGTEVYYKLQYSKKECHNIINYYFQEIKEKRFQNRVNKQIGINNNKKDNVELEQSIYNKHNKKRREENAIAKLEDFQTRKYAKRCNFRTNFFYSILKLNLNKDTKIDLLKRLKFSERYLKGQFFKENKDHAFTKKTLKEKQERLSLVLEEVKERLKNQGYNNEDLKIQINLAYERYKNKPHFILEQDKYKDLETIICKIKGTLIKSPSTRESKQEIKNNVFSILLEQLKTTIGSNILIPILKTYLNKQVKLEYSKILSNHYYHELRDLINKQKII